jgi:hypothetical protein
MIAASIDFYVREQRYLESALSHFTDRFNDRFTGWLMKLLNTMLFTGL